MVEFTRCVSARMGTPNDEVFSGHPLDGRGMEPYTAQVVRNSLWAAELERINSVHRQYDAARWRSLKHFVFWFHDSTFECVAESFRVDLFAGTFREVLARACERLIS